MTVCPSSQRASILFAAAGTYDGSQEDDHEQYKVLISGMERAINTLRQYFDE